VGVRRTVAAAALATSLALATGGPARAAPDAALGPGHARYDIAARWHAHTGVLDGVERVAFQNTRRGAIRGVWLRLWRTASGPARTRGSR